MPDIDPAALSRTDSIATSIPNPLGLSKINGIPGTSSSKAQKTTHAAQRIDLEPLYTNLKVAIGEHWGKYKEAISLFILGEFRPMLEGVPANLPCRRQGSSIRTSFP